mgnify:CR=1 FL=1
MVNLRRIEAEDWFKKTQKLDVDSQSPSEQAAQAVLDALTEHITP